MVGLFINTLPLRVQIDPTASVRAWLQAFQIRQVELRQYEYSPLVQIQGWSDVPRGQPLFESIVAFENYPMDRALQERGATLGLEIRGVQFVQRTNYPLLLAVVPGQQLVLRLSYDRRRFDDATIHRLLDHFHTLLEALIADPDRRLADVPLLTAAEREQLLVTWNATETPRRPEGSVAAPFEAQVEQTPDAVAVVCENQQLTYRELNARANQLAHHLRRLGVGAEVRVGVCLERSLELIIALLAILKAGGAYVPLDPRAPAERLAFMLADAQASVVVTQDALRAKLPQASRAICLDAAWQTMAHEPAEDLRGPAADQLAYILYTSGSTGRPKGVAVEHRQLINYVQAMIDRLGCAGASFAMVQPLTVDSCLTAIFPPLWTGGCLHLITDERAADPEAFGAYVDRHAIDCLKIAPSHLAALQASSGPERVLPRRCLVIGGEASRRDWAETLQSMAPACAIFNHYGPTETTVGVLTHRIEHTNGARGPSMLPLGRPIANTQCYVLDARLQPVPVGVPGRLYVAGAGLARGYWCQPTLTAERFLPNPFSSAPGARIYDTGDLARYLPDGTLEFLGRTDHQVKIRGFRIELGEIEAALARHPGVRECVVDVREDVPGVRRLAAYVVAAGTPAPSVEAVRQFLAEQLPDYMLPAALVTLEALPLSPHGKVDRKRLPMPDAARPALAQAFAPPQTPAEEILAGLWAGLLGVDRVGRHDNFFALGGHSLLATQIISRVRETFRVELPLRRLFEVPTIAGLAEAIEHVKNNGAQAQLPSIVPVSRDSHRATVSSEGELVLPERLKDNLYTGT